MSNENHLPLTSPDLIGDEGNYEPGSFEAWSEAQSAERLQLSVDRALRVLGLDGMPDPADAEFEAFAIEATQQAVQMYVADTLTGLERRGLVAGYAQPDGEIGYTLTFDGEQALKDAGAAV